MLVGDVEWSSLTRLSNVERGQRFKMFMVVYGHGIWKLNAIGRAAGAETSETPVSANVLP
jgi:hypothetical protein